VVLARRVRGHRRKLALGAVGAHHTTFAMQAPARAGEDLLGPHVRVPQRLSVNRLSVLRAVVMAAILMAIAALGLPNVAGAAPRERLLLVSAQAGYGSFQPQNAGNTKDVLVLSNMTGATYESRGHRTRTSAHGAAILLGRRVPFQAVLVVGGVHPRRIAVTVHSVEYLPGVGLSANVTIEKRSRSVLLRRRFPGASSRPPFTFRAATLFAAPTGITVNRSGLPTEFCFICDYPVTLEVHSTLPVGTVLYFESESSNCAAGALDSKSSPGHDIIIIRSKPEDQSITAFTARATGDCFTQFSWAKWAFYAVYPGKDPIYQRVYAYLNISQIAPQTYSTSCLETVSTEPLKCTGRAVSSFEHTHIRLSQ
jgi:hypothetical protein